MNDVMIDLETLDTKPTTVILSIGACRFDRYTGEIGPTFYFQCKIQNQINKGRTVSASTLLWWMSQSKDARKIFTDYSQNPVRLLNSVLINLKNFIGYNTNVWGNGSSFDISILEHAYGYDNLPWKPWHIRDVRTILEVINFDKTSIKFEGVAHHALSDAIHQAKCVAKVFKTLGEACSPIRNNY